MEANDRPIFVVKPRPETYRKNARKMKELERGANLLGLAENPSGFDATCRVLGWTHAIGKFYSRDREVLPQLHLLISDLSARTADGEPRYFEELPPMRPVSPSMVLNGNMLEHLAAGYACLRPSLPNHYAYGWYWNPTEDILEYVAALQRSGFRGSIWETHQFKAIERLLGIDKLNFPFCFDDALYGVFRRIAILETTCRSTPQKADLDEALVKLERASKHVSDAMDDLANIDKEIWTSLSIGPSDASYLDEEVNYFSLGLRLALAKAHGSLSHQVRRPGKIHKEFTGKNQKTGRSPNWLAELITQMAADIYRTCYPGEITQSQKGSSRPSFRVFLEDFSQGYPDAERADHRALARRVWNGEFPGLAFAPHPGDQS